MALAGRSANMDAAVLGNKAFEFPMWRKEASMNLKLLRECAFVFIVALLVGAVTTFLYSFIVHDTGVIDWQTAFTLAIILSIVLTWHRAREFKKSMKAT